MLLSRPSDEQNDDDTLAGRSVAPPFNPASSASRSSRNKLTGEALGSRKLVRGEPRKRLTGDERGLLESESEPDPEEAESLSLSWVILRRFETIPAKAWSTSSAARSPATTLPASPFALGPQGLARRDEARFGEIPPTVGGDPRGLGDTGDLVVAVGGNVAVTAVAVVVLVAMIHNYYHQSKNVKIEKPATNK